MNDTLKIIHGLRSIHGDFSEREVSKADLETILHAAVRAATASAQQSYSVIVVEDKAIMKEYLDYVGSKALIFCVDFNRLTDTAAYIGRVHEFHSLHSFITGSTDTILAAQTAAIAARSLGIDSLFTNSVHRHDLGKFYQKFELPEKQCFPLITLILGYPKTEPSEQKGRLIGPGIIHYGAYQRPIEEHLEQIVASYADPAQHLSWSTDRQGKAHLEWFFDVWLNGFKTEEKIKDPIYDTLNNAGFLN